MRVEHINHLHEVSILMASRREMLFSAEKVASGSMINDLSFFEWEQPFVNRSMKAVGNFRTVVDQNRWQMNAVKR